MTRKRTPILDQAQILARWEPGKVRPTGSAGYRPPAKDYQGLELKPYAGRPGALDFLAVPSRMGDDRRAHKPCAGL